MLSCALGVHTPDTVLDLTTSMPPTFGSYACAKATAVDAPKTRLFAQKVKALGFPGTLLIVIDKFDDNVFLSSRNLPDVLVLETREIDPVSLVRFNHVLLTKAAVAQFEEMLA